MGRCRQAPKRRLHCPSDPHRNRRPPKASAKKMRASMAFFLATATSPKMASNGAFQAIRKSMLTLNLSAIIFRAAASISGKQDEAKTMPKFIGLQDAAPYAMRQQAASLAAESPHSPLSYDDIYDAQRQKHIAPAIVPSPPSADAGAPPRTFRDRRQCLPRKRAHLHQHLSTSR